MLIICTPFAAAQASFQYAGAWDFATTTAFNSWVSNNADCFAPTCSLLPSPGTGSTFQANSSDYTVGQAVTISNLASGETVSWDVTTPNGIAFSYTSLTYNPSTGCFTNNHYQEYCGGGDFISYFAGYDVNSCVQAADIQEVGTWSISTYDGTTLLYTTTFQITHNASGLLGVTQPAQNELIPLSQGNHNATGPLTFTAGTLTGQPISWTVNLHYQSSGGFPNPATDPATLTFQGTSYTYSGFPKMGGQMTTEAQTTAPDGSTVQDCVTSYIIGPQPASTAYSIPPSSITTRLDQLYPASASYIQYLDDGTATPNLLAGVAVKESSYYQFLPPPVNADLFSLDANFGIKDAYWPYENTPTSQTPEGEYIGLMQVPTTDSNAWDWTANTQYAVNLFSGGSSSDKVQTAVQFEGYLINGYQNSKLKVSLPAHINGNGSYFSSLTGYDRENNALVLYGGFSTVATVR